MIYLKYALVVFSYLHVAHTTHPCGRPPVFTSKRIVGGNAAIEHEFPWQAAMTWRSGRTKGEHICGGSLIAKKFVLTAAHCFEHGEIPHYYNFTLGQHVYSRDSGREQDVHIKRIIVHPDYNYASYDSDLALVELDREVYFNNHVYPICLPDMIKDFEIPGKVCTITGWGADKNISSSDFLKKVDVPIVKQSVCNAAKSYGGKVTWNMFCAGYPDGRADSCGGDSGGPLQCKSSNGKYVISGVTSWGYGCGNAHKYGVYVRIRHFLDWIKSKIHGPPVPPNPKTPSMPKTPPAPPNLKTPPRPQTPPPPSSKNSTTTPKRTGFTIIPKGWTVPPPGRIWNDFIRKLRQLAIKRLRQQKQQSGK